MQKMTSPFRGKDQSTDMPMILKFTPTVSNNHKISIMYYKYLYNAHQKNRVRELSMFWKECLILISEIVMMMRKNRMLSSVYFRPDRGAIFPLKVNLFSSPQVKPTLSYFFWEIPG